MPFVARVQGRIKRLDRRLAPVKLALIRIPAIRLVVRTVREMSNDDATHMAAGVAYYAILSIFPLTIGLIAILSLILDPETAQAELLDFFHTYLPGITDLLGDNIGPPAGVRGAFGLLGILGLFWTASTLFGAVTRSVNRAWDVHEDRPFYIDKVRNIAMAMGVGLLFLLSVGATAFIQILVGADARVEGGVGFLENDAVSILARPLPFIFTMSIFLMVYKHVPNTPTYWRYIWPGALLAALSFEICKSVFVFYMENFADYSRVYGSLGSVVAFLAWTYISALILIMGAEFSAEYGRMRQGVGQGRLAATRSRGRTIRRID